MSTPHLTQYLRNNPAHEVKVSSHPINRYKASIVGPGGEVFATTVAYSMANALQELDLWASVANSTTEATSDDPE